MVFRKGTTSQELDTHFVALHCNMYVKPSPRPEAIAPRLAVPLPAEEDTASRASAVRWDWAHPPL